MALTGESEKLVGDIGYEAQVMLVTSLKASKLKDS